MSNAPKSPLTPVIRNDVCVGFVRAHARGFEAYDSDQRNLGSFVDERDAVAAVFNQKAAQP